MKKLFMHFALALAVLAMPAMAQADTIFGWNLDLGAYGTVNNIEFLSATGDGTIYQQLSSTPTPTNPGFGPGDAFDVVSLIYTVSYTPVGGTSTPLYLTKDSGATIDQLFFYSDNLTGIITGSSATDFSYEYTGGDIGMYIGNKDSIGTATMLATLSLTTGIGDARTSTPGDGTYEQSDTDITALFDANPLETLISFTPTDAGLAAAYPWLDTFLKFDFDNALRAIAPGSGAGGTTVFEVGSDARITLVATPEPSTFLILGFGLLGLVGFRRKFKKA
ncbi:PEP-CTERM motif protein [Pseudodesulfovibrio hydrargyri]|uniref:PEP-CTERM motif protein n=1 Tax=Pseudodesulfovibrio hydrargyri TaxID=2125990 RepID=A0A1J5N2X3_9BACT|nr:PEP-CTERM sorting domain-containing protein [Pseudodesulfovibrio hydrargyri]OIQ49160.1 PEP-CTERM motif protein [Pseudodesulfovibrio hydrargyri]